MPSWNKPFFLANQLNYKKDLYLSIKANNVNYKIVYKYSQQV